VWKKKRNALPDKIPEKTAIMKNPWSLNVRITDLTGYRISQKEKIFRIDQAV